MISWRKLIILAFSAYIIFWAFVGFYSVKAAIFLERKNNRIYAKIESRYERKGSSVLCWQKDSASLPKETFRGRAYGNEDIDSNGNDGWHVFKHQQTIVVLDAGNIKLGTTLTCMLHQVDFDFLVPSSNEFEITLK